MSWRKRKQDPAPIAPIEKATPQPEEALPDPHLYQIYKTELSVFQPWLYDETFASTLSELSERKLITLVSTDRLHVLKWAMQQTDGLPGEVWEMGVYKGGTALLFRRLRDQEHPRPVLRLFDSFEGLSQPEGVDLHRAGEFSDTSLEGVQALVGTQPDIAYHKGWIPDTFAGLDDRAIRLAHIDLDLYRPILDACAFVYPKVVSGGVIVFDDYGYPTCPGARKAVDEFFADRPEQPLVLPNGQAIVIKR